MKMMPENTTKGPLANGRETGEWLFTKRREAEGAASIAQEAAV